MKKKSEGAWKLGFMQTHFHLNECANMSCLILDVHYEKRALWENFCIRMMDFLKGGLGTGRRRERVNLILLDHSTDPPCEGGFNKSTHTN